jgi:hypothetical protein
MKTFTVVGSTIIPPHKGPSAAVHHRVAGPFTSRHLAEQAMVAAAQHGWCDVTLDIEGEDDT